MSATAHVPPQNLEAEESVLGAMLVAEPALTRIIDEVKLNAEDFYLDKHRAIFACVHDLYADSKPVDELTVADHLQRLGKVEEAGGKHYVSELAAKVPAAGNAKHYAEIVQRDARLRCVIAGAQRAIEAAHDGSLNGEATALSEQLRTFLSDTATAAQAVALSTVERETVEWLWPKRIPFGMQTLLMGDPGLGKSLLTIDIAAKVTRAGGDVLLLSAEDHAGATIRPRAEAAEADLERLHVVTMRREGMEDGLALPDDAAELERLVAKHRARLVIVDPLMAHLPEAVNSWRDQSVRRAMAPLHRIAQEHACAVLVVAHLNKATGASTLYRAGGSIGIPAAVRSALLLARDPDDPDGETGSHRVLAHVKCNVAPQAESLACEIKSIRLDDGPSTARFTVTGTSQATAVELLAAPVGEERTKQDDAADFLRTELEDGPRATKEIQAEARGAGIGWRTVEEAKKQLGVRASKQGFGAGWVWELPEDRTDEDRSPYISDSAVFAETASTSGMEGRELSEDREDRKTAEIGNPAAELGAQ
jgi:DnaB-like helicase N terminal domain/AAA domain